MKNVILTGSALEVLRELEDESVDCVVTSPPYWNLRDYKIKGQLGLEKTFEEFVENLCTIFDEVKRVLKKNGTCFVNIGDTYAGTMPKKPGDFGKNSKVAKNLEGAYSNRGTKNQSISDKSLLQIPSRFAIEMCNRGWILRNEIIWHKPNSMPESVGDRFTVDFEKILFFTKSKKYYFEQQFESHLTSIDEIKRQSVKGKIETEYATTKKHSGGVGYGENGRNKRCVWSVNTRPSKEAHFAVFPEELAAIMIKSGCPERGIVLDPFFGSGTTGKVAKYLSRDYIGIELNPTYSEIARRRLRQQNLF